jgi:HK97 family phage major capsid protein
MKTGIKNYAGGAGCSASLRARDRGITERLSTKRSRLIAGGVIFAALILSWVMAPTAFGVSVALNGGDGASGIEQSLPTAFAIIPFGLGFAGLREEENGGPDGGGGAIPKTGNEALDKTIGGIEARFLEHQKTIEEINYKMAEEPEYKKELEGLKKIQDTFEATTGDIARLNEKIAKLETLERNIKKGATGDPRDAIRSNPDLARLIAAPAKKALAVAKNEMIPEEVQKSMIEIEELQEKAAVATSGTPGSNLIDDDLVTVIYQLFSEYGVALSTFDVMRPAAKVTKLPVDTADPQILGIDEGDTVPEGTYTNTQASLSMEEFAGRLDLTQTFIEDDETNLAIRLTEKFARGYAKRAEFIALAADGTDDGTHKNQTGAFEAGTAFVCASGNDSFETIDQTDFQNFFDGAAEDLTDQDRARIYLHRHNMFYVVNIKDSNGRPIFQNALDAPAPGSIGSIYGTPIVRSNVAPRVNDASKPFLAYGDPLAMALGIRRDFTLASSDQVSFLAGKVVFIARCRMGSKLKQATAFEVMTTAAS